MRKTILKTTLLGVLLVSLAGCSRDEAGASAPGGKAAVSPVAPETYMKDEAFRATLKERDASRNELARAGGAVVARMIEMIEAKKKELNTSDEAVLKAALEKDPEWQSLCARQADANTAMKENRRETMRIVRERLTGATRGEGKEVSK